MEGYLIIGGSVVILAILAFLVTLGIKYLREKSNGKPVNEFVINLLENVYGIVQKEVAIYVKGLNPETVKVDDIDDIVKDILEIVKNAAGEEILKQIRDFNFEQVGFDLNIDELLEGKIREELTTKLIK